jgi:hypothetical protein
MFLALHCPRVTCGNELGRSRNSTSVSIVHWLLGVFWSVKPAKRYSWCKLPRIGSHAHVAEPYNFRAEGVGTPCSLAGAAESYRSN